MAKKILLIAYHFPPSIEVGGLRIANWSRQLPRFGWTPYVLTVMDKHLDQIDPEKLKYVGSVKVFKAGLMPTLSDGYLAIKMAAQNCFRKFSGPRSVSQNSFEPSTVLHCGTETISQRFRRYIRSFLTLPDEHRNWMLPALVHGWRVIRREKIDCVLTSSPPHSAHLVGWLLKVITGVRWIADFRDPWMTGGAKKMYSNCAVSLGIERWLEKRVVSSADFVVTNTERLSKAFNDRYGSEVPNRFICIANGFDGEFFSRFATIEKEKVFTIIYAGTLYFGRTPEPIFRAVQELIQESRVDCQEIRIRLVGQCRSIDGQPIDVIIQHYKLTGIVEVLDSVSYDVAAEMVKRSHLALLLAPNQPYQVPAKVYDYMGTGTRIMALAEDGATRDVVEATGSGVVFHPSDTAGIKEFIFHSINGCSDVVRSLENGTVEDYEIGSLVCRLADHLDHVIARADIAGKTRCLL